MTTEQCGDGGGGGGGGGSSGSGGADGSGSTIRRNSGDKQSRVLALALMTGTSAMLGYGLYSYGVSRRPEPQLCLIMLYIGGAEIGRHRGLDGGCAELVNTQTRYRLQDPQLSTSARIFSRKVSSCNLVSSSNHLAIGKSIVSSPLRRSCKPSTSHISSNDCGGIC